MSKTAPFRWNTLEEVISTVGARAGLDASSLVLSPDTECVVRYSMRYAGYKPENLGIEDMIGSFDVHLAPGTTISTAIEVGEWVMQYLLHRNEFTGANYCAEVIERLPSTNYRGLPLFEIQYGT